MAITKVSRNLLNTGVADSSDATAITIDSDEKVGIGTTSPAEFLQVHGGIKTTGGFLANTPNSMGMSYASSYGHFISWGDNSTQGKFKFTGTAGDGSPTGDLASLDSDGLKFGSDTAAANALDDYEQGTWTPAVNTGTISVFANSAEYTKIGDMVFAQARINNFSDYTSANHLILLGLPYSVGTTQSHIGTAWGNFSSPSRTMFFYASGNVYWGGTSYGLALHSNLSSSTDIIISLIYRHG